jgi:hypothetical protein
VARRLEEALLRGIEVLIEHGDIPAEKHKLLFPADRREHVGDRGLAAQRGGLGRKLDGEG